MYPRADRRSARAATSLIAATGLLAAFPAHASFLSGETLDAAADVLCWVVLIIVPIVGIAVFWMVHILPEKVAERRRHPQAKAIQTLCLLSLVFGGLLWPFAWLWAYTRPVLYKMAYGTDVGDEAHGASTATPVAGSSAPAAEPATVAAELSMLRQRLVALEASLAQRGNG